MALNGPVGGSTKNGHVTNNRICVHESDLEQKIKDMYATDYKDSHITKTEMSKDEKKWEGKMLESVIIDSTGHYVIDLPIKEIATLPNNKARSLSYF